MNSEEFCNYLDFFSCCVAESRAISIIQDHLWEIKDSLPKLVRSGNHQCDRYVAWLCGFMAAKGVAELTDVDAELILSELPRKVIIRQESIDPLNVAPHSIPPTHPYSSEKATGKFGPGGSFPPRT